MDCNLIQTKLAAYLDKEMTSTATQEIASHLKACPQCSAIATAQADVKEKLQKGARTAQTPSYLRARIRRDIIQYPKEHGFITLVKKLFEFQPQPTWAALVVLLLFSATLTYVGNRTLDGMLDPLSFEEDARLVGKLVCADCHILQATHNGAGHHVSHRMALRCEDGNLWSITSSPKGRELMQMANTGSQAVEVGGYIFKSSRYIQVTNYKVI